jgi:hypothetical protein
MVTLREVKIRSLNLILFRGVDLALEDGFLVKHSSD